MIAADIDSEYAQLRTDLVKHLQNGGRLAVVKAPPGSGKTFTLIEVLSSLVATGRRVAVAAQTNSQGDDICARFDRDHPEVPVARFTGKRNRRPHDFPAGVLWIDDKNALPDSPGVTVSTTAKWSLTDVHQPYDLLAIDEAWQMSWADLMQCALLSASFLMIGDPGQIPPVVTIDVRRWETSPRAPHEAPPEVVLADPALASVRYVGSLPACQRLPCESVAFVKPFYDFDFVAYAEVGARGVDLPGGHLLEPLADGRPIMLTVPTPAHGPPIEVDLVIADAAARAVSDLLDSGAKFRVGNVDRALEAADIGPNGGRVWSVR